MLNINVCGCKFSWFFSNIHHKKKLMLMLAFQYSPFFREKEPGPKGGGGGCTPLNKSYRYACAAPKGRDFAAFWSENEYRLCLFWSGIGYGF